MDESISDKMPHQLFGDGTPPVGTRERLLEQAQDLFYSCGFHAVGIEQVAEKAGVTKATFYNHFESRDELTAEVVKRADTLIHDAFTKAVRTKAGWDAEAALLAMFDVLDDWFNHPDFRGCLFLQACMAFPNKHDPVYKAAKAHYVATADDVANIATSIGISDPQSFAEQWVMLLQGAVSYRAVARDNRAAKIAKEMARFTLEKWKTL